MDSPELTSEQYDRLITLGYNRIFARADSADELESYAKGISTVAAAQIFRMISLNTYIYMRDVHENPDLYPGRNTAPYEPAG